MSSIAENLRRKLDEFEVERRLGAATATAEKYLHQAVEKAGDLAHKNGGSIDGFLERTSAKIDAKTDGKYAGQLGKVRQQVNHGVAKLAEHRPGHPQDPAS